MSLSQLDAFCTDVHDFEIDAVIASNTSNTREPVQGHLYAREAGGLSGAPILTLANNLLSRVRERLDNKPLIGVGGVACGKDAVDKMALGANLVQLYSGLIYHGPALVRDCIQATQTSSTHEAQSRS